MVTLCNIIQIANLCTIDGDNTCGEVYIAIFTTMNTTDIQYQFAVQKYP